MRVYRVVEEPYQPDNYVIQRWRWLRWQWVDDDTFHNPYLAKHMAEADLRAYLGSGA